MTAGPGERERQFEQLFRDHRQALLRYAARRVGSDRAEDVVADAFVVAWRRLGEVPADHQRGWLFGVASRVIANEVRSVGRRQRLAWRIARHLDLGDIEASDVGEVVRAVLARMPESYREALQLVEWDGLEPTEAAAAAGCSAAAFRVRLHRARRRLVVDYERAVGAAPEHRLSGHARTDGSAT
ncbi:MAG TPA: sigma-70 family RNA polymerase sigma factor [Jatrophihabitantaceae bacterium]|nr:sigma-70 family RNA polymerase sigma factor [Jatrophihabitantaceae bacterium]